MIVGNYEWRCKKSDEGTGKFVEITAEERAEFLKQRENLVKAMTRTEKEYSADIGKEIARWSKERPTCRPTFATYDEFLRSAKHDLERIDRILNGTEPRLKNHLDDLIEQKESYEGLLKSCKTMDEITHNKRDHTELEAKIKDLADQIEKAKSGKEPKDLEMYYDLDDEEIDGKGGKK